MKTNILVQYDGGGYDGCIWEWNFFYIDKEEGFHDIFSSGTGGIKTKDRALDLLENEGNSFSSQVFVYCLDNEKDLLEFAKETNVVLVKGVVKWFNDYNDPDAEPFALCGDCGEKIFDVDDLQLVDWHGCGGTMSTADKLLCYECYGLGICGCCNEYVGKDDVIYLGGEYGFDDDYMNKAAKTMLDDGYSDVCEGCIGEMARQLEEEEHGDLLRSSMATGKPDLFSDDMRWFWRV